MSEKSSQIYIVRVATTDYYKIGRSKDFKSRFNAMQTSTPHVLEVTGLWEVGDAVKVESYLHFKLRNYKVRGEWFEFTDDNVRHLLEGMEQKGAVLDVNTDPLWREVKQYLA